MEISFYPELSQERLAEFVRADVVADLLTIPGIGEKAVEKLNDIGITTTFQLIGQFLLLKGDKVDAVEHREAFWKWLKDSQIDSWRSQIVECIAEKVHTVCPGLYHNYQAAFDLVIIGDLNMVYNGLKYNFHKRFHDLYNEIVACATSKCRFVWTSASSVSINDFVAKYIQTNSTVPTIAIIGHSFDAKVVLTKDVDIPHDTAIFGSLRDARIFFYTCVDVHVQHPCQSDRAFNNYITSFYLKLYPSLDHNRLKEMDSIKLGVSLDYLTRQLIPSHEFVIYDLITVEKGKQNSFRRGILINKNAVPYLTTSNKSVTGDDVDERVEYMDEQVMKEATDSDQEKNIQYNLYSLETKSADLSHDTVQASQSIANPSQEEMLCFQEIARLILLSPKDIHIVDMFPAHNILSGDTCFLVIYIGSVNTSTTIINGVSVVFKLLPNPDYEEDILDWNSYQKGNAEVCAEFCGKFSRSLACIQLLSDRSDIVAVFPSARCNVIPLDESVDPTKNSFEKVIKVVVKLAGFIPFGEPPIPPEIVLDGEPIKIVVVEGYSKTCVQSGDAIGSSQSDRGFGTIAGIVRKEEPPGNYSFYAVTCKHVIEASRIVPKYLPSYVSNTLVSPPPAYRRFQMLNALRRQVFNAQGNFTVLESHSNYAMRVSDASDVRMQMRAICKHNRPTLSEGELTLKDVDLFTTHNATSLGSIGNAINPADTPIAVATTNGTIQIQITGDIALVPIDHVHVPQTAPKQFEIITISDLLKTWSSTTQLDVYKFGASTNETQGNVLRPGHIRAGQTSSIPAFYSHRKNEHGAVLFLNQLLINGNNFGHGGDSGSLVYSCRTDINQVCITGLVGIFTGKLDNQLFWASPIECLQLDSDFVWIC